MFNYSRPLVLALAASSILLSGCAMLGGGNRNRGTDTRYVARDVNTLYNAGYDRMRARNYMQAALIFDEVERQHPYSVWARRAQLMSAFNYYAARDYTKAIELDPKPRYYETRASAYEARGDDEQARSDRAKAAELEAASSPAPVVPG